MPSSFWERNQEYEEQKSLSASAQKMNGVCGERELISIEGFSDIQCSFLGCCCVLYGAHSSALSYMCSNGSILMVKNAEFDERKLPSIEMKKWETFLFTDFREKPMRKKGATKCFNKWIYFRKNRSERVKSIQEQWRMNQTNFLRFSRVCCFFYCRIITFFLLACTASMCFFHLNFLCILRALLSSLL